MFCCCVELSIFYHVFTHHTFPSLIVVKHCEKQLSRVFQNIFLKEKLHDREFHQHQLSFQLVLTLFKSIEIHRLAPA